MWKVCSSFFQVFTSSSSANSNRPLSPLSLSRNCRRPDRSTTTSASRPPNTHYLLTLFVQACITHRVRFCCRHPSGRCSVPQHHTANCQQRTHAMEAFASFADADNQFRRHRTTESATQRHGSVWALIEVQKLLHLCADFAGDANCKRSVGEAARKQYSK